jgi:uncharacterized Zn-binding protein involved in type VI secretion
MSIPALVQQDKTTQDDPIANRSSTVSFEGLPPARVGDKTVHGETITGPGFPNISIEGKPLSAIGDMTTAVVRKPYTTIFWGPGPLVGGAKTITAGKS